MKRMIMVFLCAGMFLPPNASAAETPGAGPVGAMEEPVYVRLGDDAWVGLFSRTDQYVEYSLAGRGVELQDASHILLTPHLGLMVTFADKANFGAGGDMLEAHKNWELDYQRQQGGSVESKDRNDLAGGRHDLRVTQLSISRDKGKTVMVYLVGVAMRDGVFVLSISPATPEVDPLVKKLIASVRLVNEPLDLAAEAKRLVRESSRRH